MTFEKQAAAMTKDKMVALLVSQHRKILEQAARIGILEPRIAILEPRVAELEQQVAWFERQLFGQKSERRLLGNSGKQLSLGELLEIDEAPPPEKETVKSYERRQRRTFPELVDDESQLRFDSTVPVETIEVPNPEIEGLSADQIEEVSEKVTYRLAQRRGPYVVLKYVRKVFKVKETKELSCPSAPPAVIEKSFADVSFLAGLILDKLRYHLPLYRQHQRLEACGIHISRATLINLAIRVSQLLEPIYLALFSSILQSKVLGMDETPVKAGRKEKGKMQTGYFWPIYGDKDEIVFLFAASRGLTVVSGALKDFCGILLTDGLKVYERFAEKVNSVTHAQCWVHTRRKFVEAEKLEPTLCKKALDFIAALYAVEERGRDLNDEEKIKLRANQSKPIVDAFFSWLAAAFTQRVLLPSNPFTQAANYALEREQALRVFLEYPNVPLDTNHVERALRPIPLGRKNWLFCWSELGARAVGILQSLVASCRLQAVDPYVYLVDVLQRIDCHPAQNVHLLTPRLWKDHFAIHPMLSDLDRTGQNAAD